MKINVFFAVIAALTTTMVSAQPGDASEGQVLYSKECAQCHGSEGRGNMGLPSIAGNDGDYIASRLKQYRGGEKVGPFSSMMIASATGLSDTDIANLAAFIASGFQ